MSMLTIDVIDTEEKFRALHQEWNALVDRYEAASIILTHEWLMAYCEHLNAGRLLQIIAVRDGGALIGAAPLLLETIKWRGFQVRQLVLMSHPISYNARSDFIVPERREEVLRAIAAYLQRINREWDVCVLDSLPEESQALPLLPSVCRQEGLRVCEPERYWALHYVPVQGTWGEYLHRFPKKARKQLEREEKRFDKLGVSIKQLYETPVDVAKGVVAHFDLETKSLKQGKLDYTPLDERTRAYQLAVMTSLASARQGLVVTLSIDGCVVATALVGRYRKALWLLSSMFDPKYEQGYPGHMVRRKILEYAWEHGYEQVDMNGYGWHLERWGTVGRSCYRLFVYSSSVYGQFLYACREAILPMARKTVPFLSILSSRSQSAKPGDRGIQKLNVDVIQTSEEFQQFKNQWNDLVGRYAAASVMLTHEWLMAYYNYFGAGKAFRVITVHAGKRLIGAAPLLLETIKWRGLPVRQLVLMSHPISANVRSDFIISERREEVLQAIVSQLRSMRHEWDVCVLDSLPEESRALPLIPAACREAKLLVTDPERYWMLHYVPVEGTWDDYMKGHSQHSRGHLRREERALQRLGVPEVIFHESPRGIAEGVETFIDLETRSLKHNKKDYTPLDQQTRTYFQALFTSLASMDRALVAVLQVDGCPAAAILVARYGKTLWDLSSVYDPKFEKGYPGHMIRKALLKYAWDHGYGWVDLNGYGGHLQRWCTVGRPCYRLFLYSPSVYGSMLYAMREVILPAARKVAPFLPILSSRSQATLPGDRGIES